MRFIFRILALSTLVSRNNYLRILPLHADAQLIPEVLDSEPELETFSMGIEVAGLTGLLSTEGPYTVFAPDNVAMAFALDNKYFEPAWRAHLTEILLQHVASGPPFETRFWQVGIELAPLSGGSISVSQVEPEYQLNDAVTVITPDIPAENGVIHIVDTVILPPSARDSIMDIITVIPDFFSTLESLLIQTGLDQTLQSDGPYTLFAPSNDAFNSLNPDQLAGLQSDTGALTQLLEYHICPGIFLVETLQQPNVTRLPTLQGTPLPKPLASVQFVDLLATNGAMHIVNEVLFPPNGFGPTAAPVTDDPTAVNGSPESAPTAAPAPNGTIAELIIAANFTVFVDALNLTGWLDNLQQEPGPYTVFAVPDDGFDSLPTKFLEDPIWNGHLTNVVTYHIIPQLIPSAELTEDSTIDTLNFNSMQVTSGGPLQVNGVNVTATDIPAENGVIHVVEEVLLPPSATDTALDLFEAFDQFSILFSLINSTGLYDVFNGTGPITAFAPIDDAFNSLPNGTLEELAEDPAALRNLLLYHVTPELVEFVTLGTDESRNVTTVQSGNVTFQFESGVPRINDAQVLFLDLLVQNGIVQVINMVLTPPEIPEMLTMLPSTAEPTQEITPLLTDEPTLPPTGSESTTAPTGIATEGMTTTAPTAMLTEAATTVAPTAMATEAATTVAPTAMATEAATTVAPTAMATEAATTVAPTAVATEALTTTAPTAVATEALTTTAPTAMATEATTTVAPTAMATEALTTTTPTAVATDAATTVAPTAVATEALTTTAPTSMTTEAATTVAPTAMATEAATTVAPTAMATEAATTVAPTDVATAAATTVAPTPMATEAATTVAPTATATEAITAAPIAVEALEGLATAAPTVSAITAAPTTVTAAPIPITEATAAPTEMEEETVPPLEDLTVSILEVIRRDPDFTILNDLIVETNLEETLEGDGPFTVFAPPNEAFDALPDGLVNSLLAEPESLENLLLYHVIPSDALLSSQFEDGQQLPTAQGASVTITIDGNSILVDDATIQVRDLRLENGVMHVISAVLIPPEGPPPAAIDSPTEAPVVQPTAMPVITVQPSDDCITVPGQQVCCPPGETTGIFFFCRYL